MNSASKALAQALASYRPRDLQSENAVLAAATAVRSLPGEAQRIVARIEKRRWQRDNSDTAALERYLIYVSGIAMRRLTARPDEVCRLRAARVWEQTADMLHKHIPVPKEERTVFLFHDLCRSAMHQHLLVGKPSRAKALAERALRYARLRVLWDTSRNNLVALPLADLAKAAVADNDHAAAKAALTELIGSDLKRFPFLGDPNNFLFRKVELNGRNWFQLSDNERIDSIAADRALALRDLGELYRRLAACCSALQENDQALIAFNSAIHVLRWELSSFTNRMLAAAAMLDAAEVAGSPLRQTYLEAARVELGTLEGHAKREQVKVIQDLQNRLAGNLAPKVSERPT